MAVARFAGADAGITVYRYDGRRPLGRSVDRFWRQALGADLNAGKAGLDLLTQDGNDSAAGGGTAVPSSAGFAQLSWHFSPSLEAVARWDATGDGLSGHGHSVTACAVYGPRPGMRVTLEDVFGSGGGSTVNAAWLLAY